MDSKVRLVHVARLANVSTATASRALRGHSNVNRETQRRVVAAAQQLRYRPDAAARTLRTTSRSLHGVVIDSDLARNPGARMTWLRFLHRGIDLLTADGAAAAWIVSDAPDSIFEFPLSTLTIVSYDYSKKWSEIPEHAPHLCVIGPDENSMAHVDAAIKINFRSEKLIAEAEGELRQAGALNPAVITGKQGSDVATEITRLHKAGVDGFFVTGSSPSLVVDTLRQLKLDHLPLLIESDGILEGALDRTLSTLEIDPESAAEVWHKTITSPRNRDGKSPISFAWKIQRRDSTSNQPSR